MACASFKGNSSGSSMSTCFNNIAVFNLFLDIEYSLDMIWFNSVTLQVLHHDYIKL